MNEPMSEQELHYATTAHRKYCLESPTAGKDYLEQILNDPSLPTQDFPGLQEMYAQWSRFLDPDYAPPPHIPYDAVSPLLAKSSYCVQNKDVAGTFAFGWAYLQYAPFGTERFQSALCELIDYLVYVGAVEEALPLAELFLLQRKLRSTLKASPHCQLDPEEGSDDLPTRAALLASPKHPNKTWVEIAELVLQKYDNTSPLCYEIRHNLQQYYALGRNLELDLNG